MFDFITVLRICAYLIISDWTMTMTPAIGSTSFLRAALTLMTCRYVESDIIVKPKDSETLIGGSTFFNCSTTLTSAEIHWFHYAVGDTRDRSFVYGYDQFYSSYLGRFQMEKNVATGVYNLIVSSATVDDAGRYECQDDTGRGDKDSAQLTVLDESPVCQSNIKPQGLIGPNICGFEAEELNLICSVQFHGNQAPIMQWTEVGTDNLIAAVSRNISSNQAIYYLNMKVSSQMDGSSYQCLTTRSTKSQYGCTSNVVNVAGFNRTTAIIIIIVVGICVIILSAIAGWLVGGRPMNSKASAVNQKCSPKSITPERIELIQVQDLVAEDINILRAENERLTEKVADLEQRFYSTNNAPYRTTSNSVHTIKTKAGNAPVTGIAVLESKLFVASMNYPDIEVYDAETFVFERSIENKQFTNILDIASSKEIQSLYVLNRQIDLTQCDVIRLSIAGESGKCWITENDLGRLSTYESNLIVCFSTKRIIIEYSPESEVKNIVRLSPSAGFDQLWHALKLTSTNFVVSHSKTDKQQRLCVVDNNGTVLMSFEDLPMMEGLKRTCRMNIPMCLVWDRDKSLFVADTNNYRVLLLSSNLTYEGVLLNVDNSPVRLCLNEGKDRVFVGVNCYDKKQLTWRKGQIWIYNIAKKH